MKLLLRREFTVDLPRARAWHHLAQLERWPSWARHIRRIEVTPAGELGSQTTGVIHLTNGIKSVFRMTEFNPPQNWKWVGRFLWATVEYDHVFEELGPEKTRLIWTIAAERFAVSILGKLFARIYNKNLDTAVPLLVAEMNSSQGVNAWRGGKSS
jgi:hypothetical protein